MKLISFHISAIVLSVGLLTAWQCNAQEDARVSTKTTVPASHRKPSRNSLLRWVVTPITAASLPASIREDVGAVHIGMTRDEFDKHFFHDNGLGTMFNVGEGNYHCDQGSRSVHVTVTFTDSNPTGNTALLAKLEKYHGLYLTKDEQHTLLFGNPNDTIVKVSSLWTYAPVHEAP